MVSRYREERARGVTDAVALERTVATAGRTVLFSAITVAAALASLTLFPENFLRSMGLAGALVPLIACGAALVLLPAVLTLLGPRIDALAPRWLARRAERDARATESGGWARW